jgi:8-oxo-dGTP pyrophosphatase MutT (NUDIX family)
MSTLMFRTWLEASSKGDIKRGAGIFFTDGKAFLAIKYPNGYERGTYTTPGGHMKEGETEIEAAKRESLEECGHNHGRNIGTIIERGGEWTSFIMLVPKQFKPKLSEEHTAWKWVLFTDADKVNLHPKVKAYIHQHINLVRKYVGGKKHAVYVNSV